MYTSNEMESLRYQLLQAAASSKYDHRQRMPALIGEKFPHMLEDTQLQYARFKLAVTRILQPGTIYEVGIGWGVSAQAFVEGYPPTRFYGIDNMEMYADLPPSSLLKDPDYSINYREDMVCDILDSSKITAFVHPNGPIDLIHIDGGHGLEHKANDIVKALEARPEWLLVDDVNNVMVAAGTFAGLYRAYRCPDLQMCYVGNSHTGNLLVHVNRQEPDYRGLKVERV